MWNMPCGQCIVCTLLPDEEQVEVAAAVSAWLTLMS